MAKFNKMAFAIVFFVFVIILGNFAKVSAVGAAYADFLCPQRPLVMYAGEERSVSLWLQNGQNVDEKARIKIVDSAGGILSFKEGDYLVKAKTYDKEIKVNIKVPENATLGTKYNLALGLVNIPLEEIEGIGMTTGMNVNICVQVGVYVPSLSPKTGINTNTYIVIGIVVLAILIFIIWLIHRKKKSDKDITPGITQI